MIIGRSAEAVAAAERALSLLGDLHDERDSRYVRFKAGCGASITRLLVGDLIKSRALAKELLDFANTSGSRRALSMAHYAMGVIHQSTGDGERARAELQLAHDTAPDPVYTATADTNLGGNLANTGEYADARRIIEPALQVAEERGHTFFAMIQRANRAVLLLRDGELARGMDQLEAAKREAAASGSAFMEKQFTLGMATIYARMTTGEGMASGGKLGTIMRNPGFVLGRARRASQTARETLMHLSETLPADLEGFRFNIEVELAKLLLKRKEPDEARKHIEKAIEFLRPLGDTAGMRDARALLATLDA
jgi:tetratricopeptide (TPR) repeat protein